MKKAFLEQPALLEISNEPITVVADMHGQSIHLLRIFLTNEAPPNQKYLFLGDYVDRGSQSVVVMCLLFCMKHRYPQHVFLLRGNHEDVNTTLNYGFYDECLEQWKNDEGEKVWRMFIDTFNCMPLAAVIGGKVFCAHGGISPWLESLEDINSIERPLVVPPYGLACDLLWSDPAQPERNGWGLSHRGISFTYGKSVVEEFCAKNDIALVIRGHQLFKEMYPQGCVLRFGGRLISLFSALNYEGHKNNSSVLKLEFVGQRVKVKQVLYRCRHYAPLRSNEYLGFRDMKSSSGKNEKRKKGRLESLLG
ncbi:Serine/threonine-protein phosphatase [Caenorhabditis elegans]|nr:Serine/threonine-protein phosphatase [Caenorhabditis elegans]CCD73376.1 Serine/threonine-protein phosphatase [Caenorhabditis elegans]|eukprot:NP_001249243.1 Serine/threonine-protein phosphatase [Caenorhabditis elegans]